jgi:hypothetical protein
VFDDRAGVGVLDLVVLGVHQRSTPIPVSL